MNDADYTCTAPTCACGNTITKFFSNGKPGKFCSACRERQRGTHRTGPATIACLHCSAPVATSRPKQRFCTDACKYKHRDLAARKGPKRHVQPVRCTHCSTEFKPVQTRYSTYCSRECSFAAKARTPSCAVFAGFCKGCSASFVSRRAKLYCSDSCHYRPEVPYEPLPPRECKQCCQSYLPKYTGGGVSDYCGAQCLRQATAAWKRVDKAKRKARLAEATIENVDPFVVFDRDKWRCQMCGIKTPVAKRGSYDDDASELDHIITLKDGGEHSYRNTQCSCRKCNQLKGGNSAGQLLMFG